MEALEEVLKRRCTPVTRVAADSSEQLTRVAAAAPFVIDAATAAWPCSGWQADTASVARDLVSTITVLVAAGAYDAAPARVPLHEFIARRRGYLRDFHCVLDHVAAGYEGVADLYTIPNAFADDCLNTLFDARNVGGPTSAAAAAAPLDDYRFLYWGGAGTSTMLHFDVLYSASWSANVVGYKLWLLCPPGPCETTLYDAFGELKTRDLRTRDEAAATQKAVAALAGSVGVDGAPAGGSDAPAGSAGTGDASAGPLQSDAAAAALPMHYIIQRPGDAVFVPGGWHHQVHNLTEALSINHNWFGCTHLPSAWLFLATEAARVRASLDDCRTMRPAKEAATPAAAAAAAGTAGVASPTDFDALLSTIRGAPFDTDFEAIVQRVLRMNAALNFDDFMALVLLKGREVLWQQCKWPLPTGGVDSTAPATHVEAAHHLPVLAALHALMPAWYRRQCMQAIVDTITTMLLTEPMVAHTLLGGSSTPHASAADHDSSGAAAAVVAPSTCDDAGASAAGDATPDAAAAPSGPPSLEVQRARLKAAKKRHLLALSGMTADAVDELVERVLVLPAPHALSAGGAGTTHAAVAVDSTGGTAWQRAIDLPSLRREVLAVLSATSA